MEKASPPPNERGRKPGTDWRSSLKDASPYLGLGMQLALGMAFFTIGGYLLDRYLDTVPWLTIVGGVAGMVAVFVKLIRVSADLSGGPRRESDDAHKAGPRAS